MFWRLRFSFFRRRSELASAVADVACGKVNSESDDNDGVNVVEYSAAESIVRWDRGHKIVCINSSRTPSS